MKKSELKALYIDQGLTINQISESTGLKIDQVKYQLRKHKLFNLKKPKIELTPDTAKEIIAEYFNYCEETNRIPAVRMLADKLGMSHRSFNLYKKKIEYREIFEIAISHIVAEMEDKCYNPGKDNITGIIFGLKNYGFSDRKTIKHDATGKLAKIVKNHFFSNKEQK